MKNKMAKRLLCCLFACFFVLCCIPLPRAAAEETDSIAFSTFEELRRFCDEDADLPAGSLYCEEADLVISEDLEIPSGRTVTFRSFTVPEGVVLTVMQGAEIMTYSLTVQGELINRGTVFQGDLSGDGDAPDTKIAALIPGHVENKGEMTLTDVYGKRNIRWIGSHFTMLETENYGSYKNTDSKESEPEPTASPAPEATPQPSPPAARRFQILKLFDLLEVVLPTLAFFLVIALLAWVVKAASAAKKQEKTSSASSIKTNLSGQGKADLPRDAYAEDHFQRDRRTRISQLDDWLKSGLIDRKEYNDLKKRYEQDQF